MYAYFATVVCSFFVVYLTHLCITHILYRNIDVDILLQMQHATHYTRKHIVCAHHTKFTISQRLLTHYQHLRIQIYLKTFALKIVQ
jgi:hypothetical protein